MKHILAIILLCLPCYAERNILAGSTDQSVIIRIVDSGDGTPETSVAHDTAGIDLEYRREGAAVVDITEAALTALTDAHSDGGIEPIGQGYYRLDLPDAAVADGVTGVLVHGTITGMVVIGTYIQLVDYNPYDAVRLGLTALPNAAADAAGGLPISDAGALDLDAQIKTDIDAILVDTAALDTSTKLRTLLFGSDTPGAIESTLTAMKGATFDGATDSLEALRNRGDAAWITATGFSTLTAQQVWEYATRVLTAGTNLALLDAAGVRTAVGLAYANLDTQIAGLPTDADVQAAAAAALTAYDPPTNTEMEARTIEAADYFVVGDYTAPPTADAISDGVWDEVLSGHAGVGSAGAALSAAGAAGDPWSTPLPGSYASGTAGYVIGTRIATDLAAIVGTGFDGTTDSLPALYDLIDESWGLGDGDVEVDQNTGGADNLAYQTSGGSGIVADVYAYRKADYDAGIYTVRDWTETNDDGDWEAPMYLSDGVAYTIVYVATGYQNATKDVTP